MTLTRADDYLDTVLRPWLNAKGIDVPSERQICADIRGRLNSLLAHWDRTTFRATLLAPAREEALFYQPAAPLDIRALVILCIRNSLVEDWCSDHAGRQVPLSDADVRELTGGAIHYWNRAIEASPLLPGEVDLFSVLPVQYPAAWTALTHFAVLDETDQALKYTPVRAQLPVLPRARVRATYSLSRNSSVVVLSGMSPDFDPMMLRTLHAIQQEAIGIFFAHSFKSITRNLDKLLRVIEFVFACGGAVATINSLLTNGYVARRDQLWRPAHDLHELDEQLDRRDLLRGVTPRHRRALESARAID